MMISMTWTDMTWQCSVSARDLLDLKIAKPYNPIPKSQDLSPKSSPGHVQDPNPESELYLAGHYNPGSHNQPPTYLFHLLISQGLEAKET